MSERQDLPDDPDPETAAFLHLLQMLRSKSAAANEPRYQMVVERARSLARDVLAPRANATDQADAPPADNFRALGEAGLLGLTVPEHYGGAGVPPPVIGDCTSALAAACGVTTFVLERHWLACRQLAASENTVLKAAVLPELAAGRRLCGRATTHAARVDPPPVRATRRPDGGVAFEGTAPWFTGWGLMHEAIVSGTLADGTIVHALVPLDDNPALIASAPMRLCAMNASGTVSLTCQGLAVGPERIVGTSTTEQLTWHEQFGLLGRTVHPLAVADAALALLRDRAAARENQTAAATAAALAAEADALRAERRHWSDQQLHAEYRVAAARLVGWAHELSVRVALASVAASGGSANDRDHTAQRLYREAMFYTIYLQTGGVQEAVLDWLADSARAAVATLRA